MEAWNKETEEQLARLVLKKYGSPDMIAIKNLKSSIKKQAWWVVAWGSITAGATLLMYYGIENGTVDLDITAEEAVYWGAGIAAISILISLLVFRKKKIALTEYRPNLALKSIKVGKVKLGTVHDGENSYIYDKTEIHPRKLMEIPRSDIQDELEVQIEAYDELVNNMPWYVERTDRFKLAEVEASQTQAVHGEEVDLQETIQSLKDTLGRFSTDRFDVRFLRLNQHDLELIHSNPSLFRGLKDLPSLPTIDTAEEVREKGKIERIKGVTGGEIAGRTGKLLNLIRRCVGICQVSTGQLSDNRNYSMGTIMSSFANDLQRLSVIENYDAFCPKCNAAVIDSLQKDIISDEKGNLIKLDPATVMDPMPRSENFSCPVCGHITDAPFPVHRMLSELIYPTYDRLMQENRVNRISIYSDASEKKRKELLEEKRKILEFSTEAENEVRTIKSNIRDISANVASAKETITLLSAEMAAFEAIKQSRLSQIANEIGGIVSQINSDRERIISEYRAEVDHIQQLMNRDIGQMAKIQRKEDQERMAVMKKQAEGIERLNQSHAKANDKLTEGNKLMATQIGQKGGFRASPPNVIGMMGDKVGDMAQSVSGQSDYSRWGKK
ncbi:MAG: hypothetical protein AB3N63_04930 [Puniceicoccaceae bacterium]